MENQIILIIEDNPMTRKMLRITLLAEHFEVFEAEDGKTDLKLAKKHRPNLILQDMMLPDMSGVELYKKLRALPKSENIPIIILSGSLNKMEEFQARDTYLTAFLLKPIEPSHLFDIIQSYLPVQSILNDTADHNQKILIVDDNPTQLKLLKLQLTQAGFDVSTAIDGQDVLYLFDEKINCMQNSW